MSKTPATKKKTARPAPPVPSAPANSRAEAQRRGAGKSSAMGLKKRAAKA